MKYLYLSGLCIILSCVVNAQLRITPQFGIENSKTSLSYNNSSDFSPLGVNLSPHASVRFDYTFKKLHGPFVGLATSRSAVNYSFTDPETGKTNYTASRNNKQLRLEGGYQLSTKPIYFNKAGAKNKASNISTEKSSAKKSCRDFYTRSHCGSKSYKTSEATSNGKGSWVSIQPSAGMAYIPTASAAEIETKSQGNINTYEYSAGNWKTAFIAGAGFVFGKNDQQKLVVSVNYLRGIGNLQEKSLTTTTDAKASTTYISSNASQWNLRVGIPISFAKNKKQAAPKEVIMIRERRVIQEKKENTQPKTEKKCGSSMYRCRKAA
ncbi:MAG: hypothetical protein H7122_12315 [Chitinophagaceae bacterium]|nr:hypothetical protein [Chitinophagaceae bacterium]